MYPVLRCDTYFKEIAAKLFLFVWKMSSLHSSVNGTHPLKPWRHRHFSA